MPSLKVKKSNVINDHGLHVLPLNQNTFHHFYFLPNQNQGKNESKSLFCIFIESITVTIVANISIYFIKKGWRDIFTYRFATFWHKYELYYAYLWFLIIAQIVIHSFLLYVFMNTFYKHSLKFILFISFVVNGLINGISLTWLAYQYIHNDNVFFYLQFVCDLNEYIKNDRFEYMCPFLFSFYSLYFDFNFVICLLLNIISHHCLYLVNCKINDNYNYKNKTIQLQASNDHEMQVILLNNDNIDINSESQNDGSINIVNNIDPNVHENDNVHHVEQSFFYLYILFVATYLVFKTVIKIVNFIIYYIKPFNYFYYSLLLVTCLFKIVFKQIARKIDILRINIIDNDDDTDADNIININIETKWYNFISFEILMEYFIDMIYFGSYYILFIVELSDLRSKDNNGIYFFFEIELLHVISEICQSTIRYSACYFNTTNKLYTSGINYFQNDDNCNNLKCINVNQIMVQLFELFKDESNLHEWQTRHCIDTSFKVLSLINSFVIVYG